MSYYEEDFIYFNKKRKYHKFKIGDEVSVYYQNKNMYCYAVIKDLLSNNKYIIYNNDIVHEDQIELVKFNIGDKVKIRYKNNDIINLGIIWTILDNKKYIIYYDSDFGKNKYEIDENQLELLK